MLKIRLQRTGRKNNPSFRVIVTDSHRGPKSGNHVELLGSYDPRKDTKTIKADRVLHWISKGAQVSDTVHNLLVSEGIIKGDKKNVLPKKSPIVKEKEEEADEKAPAGDAEDGGEEGGGTEEETKEAPTEDAEEKTSEVKEDEAPKEEVKSAESETSEEEKKTVE